MYTKTGSEKRHNTDIRTSIDLPPTYNSLDTNHVIHLRFQSLLVYCIYAATKTIMYSAYVHAKLCTQV